jgi:SpoVK/Ycf46/Vps4 family AAA+-type ATPase
LLIANEKIVPDYFAVRNVQNCLTYLANLDPSLKNSPEDEALALYQGEKKTKKEILDWYAETYPERIYKHFNKLKSTLSALESLKKKEDLPEVIDFPFEIEDIYFEEEDLKTFVINAAENNCYGRSIITVGGAGLGKTMLLKLIAKILADKKLKDVLYIRDKQQLEYLNKQDYKVLIYDEINFDDFKNQELINLLDIQEESTIRILYGKARKRKGMPVLLATNDMDSLIKKLKQSKILNALFRRSIVLHIKTQIMPYEKDQDGKNINIKELNVDIMINNIVNNSGTINLTMKGQHLQFNEFKKHHPQALDHPLTLANKETLKELTETTAETLGVKQAN